MSMEDFADRPDLDAARARPITRVLVAGPDLNFVERDFEDSKPTGRQVAEAFLADDPAGVVVLQWLPNGMLEGIRLDETVDLRERGVERFIVGPGDGTHFFELQGRRQEWLQSEITVRVLKILGDVGDDAEVVLEREDAADEVLGDDAVVLLDGPNVEKLRLRRRTVTVTILITIDGEPYTVEDRDQTPNRLLALAVPNPTEHYLVEIENKKQVSYQGRGDEAIHIQKGDTFVTVFTGATTVSELPPRFGAAHFQAGLTSLGYEVTDHGAGNLSFPYEVEVGPLRGRVVTLGFKVPDDFPVTPPSGPLVMPHVHALQAGGVHPTGGVHLGSGFSSLGDGFQYWSRPFPNWATSRRTVAEYMAFIRHLWATQ